MTDPKPRIHHNQYYWIAGWTAVYIIVTLLTDARYFADTKEYVDSLVAYRSGDHRAIWEFGHVLWRPLGLVVHSPAEPLLKIFSGSSERASLTLGYMSVAWISGLLAVLAMYRTAYVVTSNTRASALATVFFLCSQGILNFSQSGTSYIPGLAALMWSLYFSVHSALNGELNRKGPSIVSGGLFALAVLLWLLHGLAGLCILAAPLLLCEREKKSEALGYLLRTVIVAGAVILLGYFVMFMALGVHSVADVKTAVAQSSHGVETRGFVRMVFGLSRSFIFMGNDGPMFKRYLVHDPYNPVSAGDILRSGLWLVALFYVTLLLIIPALLQRNSKRFLWFALSAVLPVCLFAYSFDGGAVERYLDLYPIFFLTVALALWAAPKQRFALRQYGLCAIFAVFSVFNLTSHFTSTIATENAPAEKELALLRTTIAPKSCLTVLIVQDQLATFVRAQPLHPLNAAEALDLIAINTANSSDANMWRSIYAQKVQTVWSRGGEMWVRGWLFAERPAREWNWVEGEDPRVTWKDTRAFFLRLHYDSTILGDNGFSRLARDSYNSGIIDSLSPATPEPISQP